MAQGWIDRQRVAGISAGSGGVVVSQHSDSVYRAVSADPGRAARLHHPPGQGHAEVTHRKLRAIEFVVVALLLALILVCVAQARNIIVADENGALIRQCESPAEFVPQQGAIICRTPVTIHHDGFE